jgi:uncharacterized protein YraI
LYTGSASHYGIGAGNVHNMSGCGILFGGGDEAPTPTAAVDRALVPTFTPTPLTETIPTPEAPPPTATQVIENAVEAPTASEATPTTAPEASPTAAPTPKLPINENAVNVRLGPGTSYGLAGAVNQGQEFTIVGRDQNEDWWLICCVNGKEVWVSDELTSERDEGVVAVVTDIPAAPQQVAAAPTQAPAAQPAPAEPTATPAPAAPPPAADPCAGIGGDGCKFKLRGGPSFAANGGGELKLQLHFIHGGVDGGQPQGSYFVWMEKDGAKLPISDSIRSICPDRISREHWANTITRSRLRLVRSLVTLSRGNYALWVLDGNGERDSQTFTLHCAGRPR